MYRYICWRPHRRTYTLCYVVTKITIEPIRYNTTWTTFLEFKDTHKRSYRLFNVSTESITVYDIRFDLDDIDFACEVVFAPCFCFI